MPSRLRAVNLTHLLINTLLLGCLVDFWHRELPIYDGHDVTFARVGATYSDGVKIHVRYPDLGNGEDGPADAGVLKVIYKEAGPDLGDSTNTMWKDGPVLKLSEENDWVGVAHIQKLWPNTAYECESRRDNPCRSQVFMNLGLRSTCVSEFICFTVPR